jgi:excisionase family DNA binding protein
MEHQLLSLPALAEVLKLPADWLKREADAGEIPHLKIGHRYRFNRTAVETALARRAARGKAVRDVR